MRLLLFLILFLFTNATFGQKTTFDQPDTTICSLPVECVAMVNGKPIKPFISTGYYAGKVVIKAQLDTLTMKLVRHKIIFADLHSKIDPHKKIEVRLDKQSGDIKYLNTIFPDLIKHLKYLKFKIIAHKDCVMTTEWLLPITVSGTNPHR